MPGLAGDDMQRIGVAQGLGPGQNGLHAGHGRGIAPVKGLAQGLGRAAQMLGGIGGLIRHFGIPHVMPDGPPAGLEINR